MRFVNFARRIRSKYLTKTEITMNKHTHKLAGGIAALLAMTAVGFADVKINDTISVSGYVTGTAARSAIDTAGVRTNSSTMDVDSFKLSGMVSLDKVSGTVSLHSFASYDPVVLDAYATYNAGNGSSVTVGKFLSYLGFEAFDYPNMLQISYANSLAAFIPAYHSGVRYDYSSDGFSGGVAVLDSVYGPTYYEGDHDLTNGAGFEAYIKFTSGGWTTFLAAALDKDNLTSDQTTYDIWTQYVINKTTLAAEYCYSDVDGVGDGYFWLLLAMQSFDKWSLTGRLSGGVDDTFAPNAKFTKYTISPAFTLTDNLGFLFEYSWIDYKNTGFDNGSYLAAQFVFKF